MQEKEQCDSLPSRTMPSLAGPALAQCLQATPANAAVLLQLVHLMRHEQLQQALQACKVEPGNVSRRPSSQTNLQVSSFIASQLVRHHLHACMQQPSEEPCDCGTLAIECA
jgi:hypothetical protein